MANEIELNGLADTNNLPDDWKISLINPATLQPAQNIVVAHFIELLTSKMPTATKNSKGLLSAYDKENLFTQRETLSENFSFKDAVKPGMYKVLSRISDMPAAAYPYGVLIVFNTGAPTQIYIPDPQNSGNKIFIRQQWTDSINDAPWKIITLSDSATFNNLFSDTKNTLTETIALNNSTLPPPRKLRAKHLRISKFRRAICEIRYFGNRQPGWFNSS